MLSQYALAILLFGLRTAQPCGLQAHSSQNEHALERRTTIPSPPYKKTVINNLRVFDGHVVLEGQSVIIDGARIGTDPSNADEVIDGKGQVLIPGLIDSHGHVSAVEHLENLSSYGVTTILNMSCFNSTICAVLRSHLGLTSVSTAGNPVIAPGSDHARTAPISPSLLITDPSQAEQLVTWAVGNGSQFMKLVSEESGPTQEMHDAVVLSAHRHGIPTTTHASWLVPFYVAVDSKTDGLQHTVGDSLIPDEWLAKVKSQDQHLTPTLVIHRYVYTHPEVREYLQGPGPSNQTYDIARENVGRMHRAGITLLAGTDAVGASAFGPLSLPHGITLHQELENLVEAGFTPLEALRAATSLPARHQNLPDRGMIAPGMRADLVLLNSDPFVNISNTKDIARVWIGGIEYPNVTKLETL